MFAQNRDVIEHVISVNGVVERNRNSVVCGSAAARIMGEEGWSGVPASPPTMEIGGEGQWALCESRVVVHPSARDHHPTTPAASLRYSPLRRFFPLFAPLAPISPIVIQIRDIYIYIYVCIWDAGTSCSVFFSSNFFFFFSPSFHLAF